MNANDKSRLDAIAVQIGFSQLLRQVVGQIAPTDPVELQEFLSAFEEVCVSAITSQKHIPGVASEHENYVKEAASAFVSHTLAADYSLDD